MKKTLSLVLSIALILSMAVFPVSAHEVDSEVVVSVEYCEEDNFYLLFQETDVPIRGRSSVVDLSAGSDLVTVGSIASSASWTSSTYKITKTSIVINLQSLYQATKSIQVDLYRSDTNSDVATKVVSINASSPLNSTSTTKVTFSNLRSTYTYYIVITNLDTAATPTILATVKQA
ncbi:MAG: hypothetical protein IJO56_09910 [Oscillospiraceae bacterium]|nr:hypothetical protein [Oscillospiraceae bacterium]